MSASPTLSRVLRGQLCSGCGACAAIAPEAVDMKLASPGYLRPVQTGELTQQQETQISGACPGFGLERGSDARDDHPLWGPITGLRSGYSTDPALRRNASSGGVLSALLVHVLETGLVSKILHTSADPSLPIGNASVVSMTSEAVFRAAGSRYAPSAPLAELETHLVSDDRLAFVGKPCDVAALRSMAQYDPRISERIPVMLSFFCAGIPSHAGAREILERLDVKETDLASFRYRGDGWPGFASATLKDGSQRRMSYANSWGGILSHHVQFRCKICPDGTGSFADIVCADAWEADENGYPIFEEQDGISLIVSRTTKGEAIVRAALEAGRITAEPFQVEDVRAIQPGQTQRRQFTLPRVLALVLMGRPAPRYKGFYLVENAFEAGLWATAKNFLGTLRRILGGQL